MKCESFIALHQVIRVFPGPEPVYALNGVSLDLPRGAFVLLEGPSGSGKTTLLGILGALDRPTSGRVTVDGVDIAGRSAAWLAAFRRHRVGFVFQDSRLLESLTAEENVALALQLGGCRGSEATRRAAALLELLGLGGRRHRRPARLSAGERQRVAIARAAVDHRPLLLADEPTANLDSACGQEVARLLRTLVDEGGVTAIVASHDWRLEEFADTVIRVEDGAVVNEEERSCG
jgi:putative ABC transport system ATP-binding protein